MSTTKKALKVYIKQLEADLKLANEKWAGLHTSYLALRERVQGQELKQEPDKDQRIADLTAEIEELIRQRTDLRDRNETLQNKYRLIKEHS